MSGPARLAIIEDDAAHARQLQRTLALEGYRVDIFGTPEEALAACETRPPELVVTDLRLPGMDGVALCERLAARHPGLPVILVTAFGSVDTAKRALRLGAYDYLLKPLDVDELLQTIARCRRTGSKRRTPRCGAS